MSFGQQWLNDWEDKEEAKRSPVEPFPPPVSLREMVLNEVARYLAIGLAQELTDNILTKVIGKQS